MEGKRTTAAKATNKPKSSRPKGKNQEAQAQTKKTGGRKAKTKPSRTAPEKEPEQQPFHRQAWALGIFCLAVLMTCLMFISGESGWNIIHNFIYGLFGGTSFLWCALAFAVSIMMARDMPVRKLKSRSLQLTMALVIISAAVFVIMYEPAALEQGISLGEFISSCYESGKQHIASGVVGGSVGGLLVLIFGKVGALIMLALSLFAFVMVITRTGLWQLLTAFTKPVKKAREHVNESRSERERLQREARSYRTEISSEPGFNLDVPLEGDLHPKRKTNKATQPEPSEAEQSEEERERDLEMDRKLSLLLRAANGTDEERQQAAESEPAVSEQTTESGNEPEEASFAEQPAEQPFEQPRRRVSAKQAAREEIAEQAQAVAEEVSENSETPSESYVFPPMDLLSRPDTEGLADESVEMKLQAERLIVTLEEYGVKASVSDISRGPTVTRYEIKPAAGIKISRITGLSKDIALRLAAQSIRIEAPIPGKPAVGIEIPNSERRTVKIRELIDSRQFETAKGSLVAVVGKDVEGNIILCDIAKMPHLLIAGSTGSGKSVCVNSMLMSLMYKYTPEEVRMVLVDPKTVEFTVYNGIPHLLVPVVCNAKKAAGVLQWAVSEMQKRYQMLNEHNVRSLEVYNKRAEETGEFEKLPRIIIVIDEMADLMQTSPKEVEDAVARLAAMARAAGMHMILATQRPSVDVITGVIKNNIPSRIALTVTSQVDSRTILDSSGAETLIGYGDMLYNPMGISKPKRVQGCFISDSEVESVIKFLKRNGEAEYDSSISEEIERKALENDGKGESSADSGFDEEDPTLLKAIEAVIQAGQASASLLQRKLSVGYARAGRLIDQLEERGIIGPYEGSKPRQVIMTRTQWLEMSMNNGGISNPGVYETPINEDARFTAPVDLPGEEDETEPEQVPEEQPEHAPEQEAAKPSAVLPWETEEEEPELPEKETTADNTEDGTLALEKARLEALFGTDDEDEE